MFTQHVPLCCCYRCWSTTASLHLMLVFVGEKDAQTNPDQETKKKGQLKAKECQSELMSTLKAPIFPRIATDLV